MATNFDYRLERAYLVAYSAHGAYRRGKIRGQRRADGVTPYILHPLRVVELILEWTKTLGIGKYDEPPRAREARLLALAEAGYLHDVLEDTGLTREDLLAMHFSPRTIELVELLTKPAGTPDPASAGYYQRIALDTDALVLKCADRCANLEDVLQEVQSARHLQRWKKYVLETYVQVLPMYRSLPVLRLQLFTRLERIHVAWQAVDPVGYEILVGAITSAQLRASVSPTLPC